MKYKLKRNTGQIEVIQMSDPKEFRINLNRDDKFITSDINIAYRFIEYLSSFYKKYGNNYTWKIVEEA